MSNNQAPDPISRKLLSESTIVQLILGITFALILVEFWRINLEATIFVKLGIQKTSAYQTFIVAITLTLILIILISFLSSPVNDIIIGVDPANNVNTKTQSLISGQASSFTPAVECKCRQCGDTYYTRRITRSKNTCRKCVK